MNARYDCFCKLTDLLGAQESLTEARRHLHQFPELSFQEKSTAQWVADKLQAWGYQVTRNVGGHGLVATLKNGEGKGIALRALAPGAQNIWRQRSASTFLKRLR